MTFMASELSLPLYEKRSSSSFYIPIYCILLINYIYLGLFHSLFNPDGFRLAEQAYFQHSSIFIALLSNTITLFIFIFSLLPIFLSFRKQKNFTWSDFHTLERTVICFIVILITWVLVVSPTNFYFGHPRIFDRILLILIGLAIVNRPAFIPLYCLFAFSFFNELNYPLGGFSLSEKGAMLNILILAISFFTVRCFVNGVSSKIFLFLATVVHLQNYFWAGVEKLKTGGNEFWSWPFENNTSLLIIKSRLDGYAHQIDLNGFLQYTAFLKQLNVPINLAVLILELLVCLAFYNKKFLILILVFCSFLNVGVFANTGILFYEWLLLGFLLSIVIWHRSLETEMFRRNFGPLAFILILFANVWHYPHKLGWVDHPVLNVVEIYAKNKDGSKSIINENSFAPFDRIFNYDENFLFFTKQRIISKGYFAYVFDARSFLKIAKTADEFIKYQKKMGHSFYDEKKILKFDRFIRRFVERGRANKQHFFYQLFPRPPFHLNHNKMPPHWEVGSDLKVIEVVHKQFLILEGKPLKISDETIYQLKIN